MTKLIQSEIFTKQDFHKVYEIKVSRINEMPCDTNKLDMPEQAVRYWKENIEKMPWYDPEREQCVTVMLNTRYRPTGHNLVSIGSLIESIAHPRDIFRGAVATNAYAIILMHNHPSGEVSPSEADHRLTRRIQEGATLLQITFLDHVIVPTTLSVPTAHPTGPHYFSFKAAGVL